MTTPVTRSERQVLAAAANLGERAFARLGEPAPPTPKADRDDPTRAARTLAGIAELALELLRRHGEDHPDAGEWTDVAVAALDLEAGLRGHIAARQARRRAELDRSLVRLRATESSAELLERLCQEAARGCGMGRVLLSRVREGVWSPWKLHDGRAPGAAPPPWMSTTAIALEALALESTVIATARPATIADAASDARVHQTLRRLMQFESFVVAPIAPAGDVLGLLHADRVAQDRSVDDDDRDLLWTFAAGAGRVYERMMVLERFEAQRRLVRDASTIAESIMASLHGEIELVRLVAREQPPSPAADELSAAERRTALDAQLTPRERDVLALMAKGHANDAIAERLAVTRSTVKSHVRSLLRKLGAVNRAEAISRYHGMSTSSGSFR